MHAIDTKQVINIKNLELTFDNIHYVRLLISDHSSRFVRINTMRLAPAMRIGVAKQFTKWLAETKYLEDVSWFLYDFHSIKTMEHIARGMYHTAK